MPIFDEELADRVFLSCSAYLTVSEIFPLEVRALAIAFFYAIGTAIGGVSAPYLFSALIQSGKVINITSRERLFLPTR